MDALEKNLYTIKRAGNPLFRLSDLCRNLTPLLRLVLFPLQSLGNSQREYEKHVLLYSIRNQLRFRNNLGETACSFYNSHTCIHFAYRFTFI